MKRINRTVVSDGQGNVIATEEVEYDVPVPESVKPHQLRLELLARGRLAAAKSYVDSLPAAEREAAQTKWEYMTEIRRDDPLILGMAAAFGLTSAQLDDLFILASER